MFVSLRSIIRSIRSKNNVSKRRAMVTKQIVRILFLRLSNPLSVRTYLYTGMKIIKISLQMIPQRIVSRKSSLSFLTRMKLQTILTCMVHLCHQSRRSRMKLRHNSCRHRRHCQCLATIPQPTMQGLRLLLRLHLLPAKGQAHVQSKRS